MGQDSKILLAFLGALLIIPGLCGGYYFYISLTELYKIFTPPSYNNPWLFLILGVSSASLATGLIGITILLYQLLPKYFPKFAVALFTLLQLIAVIYFSYLLYVLFKIMEPRLLLDHGFWLGIFFFGICAIALYLAAAIPLYRYIKRGNQ